MFYNYIARITVQRPFFNVWAVNVVLDTLLAGMFVASFTLKCANCALDLNQI